MTILATGLLQTTEASDIYHSDSYSSYCSLNEDEVPLQTFLMGSNRFEHSGPLDSETDASRYPRRWNLLIGKALRDLALSTQCAVLVDAQGDVYYCNANPTSSSDIKPILLGKDIKSVAVTPFKTFALSSNGKIFVLSTTVKRGVTERNRSIWDIILFRQPPLVDFEELVPDTGNNERFINMATGANHLLALTVDGRTFGHPVSDQANAYGQLGIRNISSRTKTVELVPTTEEADLDILPQPSLESTSNIRWCTSLYLIPMLKPLKVTQIAAGDRASYVLTDSGRVFSWGSNKYYQLGIGPKFGRGALTTLVEIKVDSLYPSTMKPLQLKCVGIHAGQDLAYINIEATYENLFKSVDLWACGIGSWGGVGGKINHDAIGRPVKITPLSGKLDYNKLTEKLMPVFSRRISISDHILVTIWSHNLEVDKTTKELWAWGSNESHQVTSANLPSISEPLQIELVSKGQVVPRKLRQKIANTESLSGRMLFNQKVEEYAVTGPECNAIYWKIVE